MLDSSSLLELAPVGAVEDAISGALAGTPLSPFTGPIAGIVVAAVAVTLTSNVVKLLLQVALTPLLTATQSSSSVSQGKYELGRQVGRGSYGEVYEASGGGSDVIIKASTTRDARGQQFAQAELFMNRKLSICGQSNSMAKFEGHYYGDGGLNLVFKREGTLTLDQALQSRDFPWNVEYALFGKESEERTTEQAAAIVRRISSQIFGNLAGIHSWSVVHRDVKGANLILAEDARRFKLLDFGAACDLFSGTNYDPKLQVFDPKFGPPEADITKAKRGEGGLVTSAGGRFDVFCAGLIVVQMCFSAYRSDAGIVQFKKTLDTLGYDLDAWREAAEQRKENALGFEILDKYGGFALLKGCFKEDPTARLSSAAAASNGFCR